MAPGMSLYSYVSYANGTRDGKPMMARGWASGTTLGQHWFNILCLLGKHCRPI